MGKLLAKINPAWFYAFFAIAILWRLLLPGYVLTLDMVFGPQFRALTAAGIPSAGLLNIILQALSFIFPMWLVQKIILVILFFALGYLPYRFFPGPQSRAARVWLGVFYLFNPFVYERFLAGQWMLLFAYALLPVLFNRLESFCNQPALRQALVLAFWLFVIANFSPHFLFISACIIIVRALFAVWQLRNDQKRLFRFGLNLMVMIIAAWIFNASWLYPLWQGRGAVAEVFSGVHQAAFVTAADPRFGAVANVAMLYGFWGEHEPWIENFWLPKKSGLGFFLNGPLLWCLVLGGIFVSWHRDRALTQRFLIFGGGALFLSLGLASSATYPLNNWLFAHLPFYAGFRDTEKWSGLLAATYAFFGAYAIAGLTAWRYKIPAFVACLFLLPIISVYGMLGGFGRQLSSVQYPQEWQEAEIFLKKQPAVEKILFLPWHQYLTFSFNFNQLAANPAQNFFSQEVITSTDMELHDLKSSEDSLHQGLNALFQTQAGAEEFSDFLANNKINYVILSHDLQGTDSFDYAFLETKKFDKIWQKNFLTIYKAVLE